MISLFKFRRLFNRKLACFFSAFIILLTFFFTVPASASSVSDEFTFYQACPVVFNFCINATDTDNWLDPYSLDFNFCPVASIPQVSSNVTSGAQITASDAGADIFGDASYSTNILYSNLSTVNGEFVGEINYLLNFIQLRVYSGYDGMVGYDTQYKYKFNNFWVWSFNYSDVNSFLPDSKSNISFYSSTGGILSSRLTYDILVFDSSGSPFILNDHVLYLEEDDLSDGETFGNLTPEFFINHDSSLSEYLDSPDDYFFVHVDTWEATTFYNLSSTPSFELHYCFNPYLDDLSTLYNYFSGSVPSPDDPTGNPAFGFIPYTDWLGSAVSGFFDLQIFPGFTLGGVFISVFSFACVMWFLKLVAGG